MKLKPILGDIKDFIRYLLIEPFEQIGLELKEIMQVLTKKKTWVWLWFWVAIVFMVFRIVEWALFSITMCLAFLVIYQWQLGVWKHKKRERWKKKQIRKGKLKSKQKKV